MSSEKLYEKLTKLQRPRALLGSLLRLAEWEQETLLPPNGLSLRAEQTGFLTKLSHQEMVKKEHADLLNQLIDLNTGKIKLTDLDKRKQSSLREMRRDYLNVSKLPEEFVTRFAKTTTESLDAWKRAKAENKFSVFLPHLEKVVSLCREKTDYLGFDKHPYDALLDLYEPGMTVDKLDTLFSELKSEQVKLLSQITKKITSPPPIEGNFPFEKQMKLSKQIIEDMGMPPEGYRIDTTAHPFCLSFSPSDVRLTTHIHEDDFLKSLYAVIHETGHGLYEANLPKEDYGTPLCEAASFGVHESQSRFWEVFIGSSMPFLTHYFPLLQKTFNEPLKSMDLSTYYQTVNRVEASYIRIYSDEVSYNLHIIIRYEIEKALIEGSLEPKDLPAAFNAKMESLLGLVPQTDSMGCMQDIHWSMALFGYFPSYSLGNLYAGALFEYFNEAIPAWKERVSSGELLFITEFLKNHIHKYGREFQPVELIERATKRPFTSKPYLKYLSEKYLG